MAIVLDTDDKQVEGCGGDGLAYGGCGSTFQVTWWEERDKAGATTGRAVDGMELPPHILHHIRSSR